MLELLLPRGSFQVWIAYGEVFVPPLLQNTQASGKVEVELKHFPILHFNNPEKKM